uniref:Uncharacterized protein n=1 Tax=Alexandrium monilatum TaxID=311494 RepID=A0A7S4RR88_9DINO|mmetsp:Transcript_43842/g.137227  ORF Transcript_43842/g.137227 Transcript_43842/m.137227 type:complete len:354 (-) Transcript_43842:393-1454(-)
MALLRRGAGARARRRGGVGLAAALGASAACALSSAWALLPRRLSSAAPGALAPTATAGARGALTAARLRDRSTDVAERPPPEPRSRGPRTERDVANDVVFGVVAVELLFNHDRLDTEVGSAFRRAVYDPVLERLQLYSNSSTSEARSPAKSWRLQDRVLERQFSLSNYFTEEVAVDLDMRQAGEVMLPFAQLDARCVLRNANVEASDDPVSSALVAWSSHHLRVGGGEAPTSLCRRRPFGYAAEKPEVSEWLLPVFVEHDRSSHAERMALISLGDIIKRSGGKLHPDAPIHGAACVYASHTPCISCLAVFCQFKRKLPSVKLYFCFDTWGDTRRWIDDACLHEDLTGEEEDEG